MPPDPADLVNTILAATPSWFFDQQLPATIGAVMVGHDDNGPIFGDPRPVAARQAAAALLVAVEILRDGDSDTCGCGCNCANRLRELADQLDTQETP